MSSVPAPVPTPSRIARAWPPSLVSNERDQAAGEARAAARVGVERGLPGGGDVAELGAAVGDRGGRAAGLIADRRLTGASVADELGVAAGRHRDGRAAVDDVRRAGVGGERKVRQAADAGRARTGQVLDLGRAAGRDRRRRPAEQRIAAERVGDAAPVVRDRRGAGRAGAGEPRIPRTRRRCPGAGREVVDPGVASRRGVLELRDRAAAVDANVALVADLGIAGGRGVPEANHAVKRGRLPALAGNDTRARRRVVEIDQIAGQRVGNADGTGPERLPMRTRPGRRRRRRAFPRCRCSCRKALACRGRSW